jgi:hypothetical protein
MSLSKAASNRGKNLLILDDFKFRFAYSSKSSGEVSWRCSNRSCPAKVVTVSEENHQVLRCSNEHNHESDRHKLQLQLVRSACKRKAIDSISVKPAKLIRSELATASCIDTIVFADVKKIREAVYDVRRSLYPPLPKSKQDVHDALDAISVKTTTDENFILVNDRTTGIAIFSCETNLRFLCTLSRIYVDGTFSYCTKFFVQMFTIHGVLNGHYVPLVFALLPAKATNCYASTFKYVVDKCVGLGVIFSPAVVVADFEIAIHNSVRSVWPNASIVGCRFHLAQAWWRNIKSLKLSMEYKDGKSDIGKWLVNLFGLPFLPPSEVSDCFVFDFLANQPADPRLDEFSDYLVANYVEVGSNFPPEIWADNSESMLRTTNACESFHSRFNASFYSTHPSLFLFIDALKDFQVDTLLKIRGSNVKAVVKDARVKNRVKFLSNQLSLYSSGSISRMQFVSSVSYQFKAIV